MTDFTTDATDGWCARGGLGHVAGGSVPRGVRFDPAAGEATGGGGGEPAAAAIPPGGAPSAGGGHWVPGPAAGEGGAAGGAAGGEAGGAGGGAPDPWAQPVPDHLRELGAENFDDVRGWRQAASLAEAQRELIDKLLAAGASPQQAGALAGQGGAPGAPAAGAFDWYGLGSKEAYLALWQTNPGEAERRRAAWSTQQARAELEKQMGPQLSQMQRQQQTQAWGQQVAALQARYGETAKNPVVAQAFNGFIQQHGDWLQQAHAARPDLPWPEFVWKISQYERLENELKAATVKMNEIRGTSGSARTSVGGPAVNRTAPMSHAEAARQAMEKVRQAGGDVPPGAEAYIARLEAQYPGKR